MAAVQRVVLVDVGLGNLHSVQRALERGASDAGRAIDVSISSDPDAVARADRVVFPGQGAFRDCARALAGGLGQAIAAKIATGAPFLGICLGLQVLFDGSDEAPGEPGLGVFAGHVARLAPGARDPHTGEAIKIPHMGWNRVALGDPAHPLLARAGAGGSWFYFVHSFHAVPADPSLVVGTAQHGPYEVTAAIARDNVLATQFHPEKSQAAGLRVLAAFFAAE